MTHLTLIQGETFREGLTITGLGPAAERIEITWRNSLGRQVKKWTLEDGITELSANNYAYHLTNLETLAIPGRGTWQIEVVSDELGVKKSFSGTYEIAKATNLTTETVAITPTNFNIMREIDFTEVEPTISVLESGLIVINDVTIGAALDEKVDKVDGKGLSTNDYTTTEKQKAGRVFDCLEFDTYAEAVAGLVGVTGRRLIYVIDDTVNGNDNGGWYGWNGSTLGELLWLA